MRFPISLATAVGFSTGLPLGRDLQFWSRIVPSLGPKKCSILNNFQSLKVTSIMYGVLRINVINMCDE